MRRVLGSSMGRVLGALLGWVAGSVLRIRRAHVEAAMAAAGIGRPGEQARAMYAALGMSAVEFFGMAVRGRAALGCVRIDEASRGRWERVLAEGRGVVVAASHTGNWDMAACAIAQEVELLVVTKHLSIRWMDRVWQATRARLGVELSDAWGAIARGRAVLRRRGVVAMMIDQVPISVRHASRSNFSAGWPRPTALRLPSRRRRGSPSSSRRRVATRPVTTSSTFWTSCTRRPDRRAHGFSMRPDGRRSASIASSALSPTSGSGCTGAGSLSLPPHARRSPRHRRPQLRQPPDRRHRQVQGRRRDRARRRGLGRRDRHRGAAARGSERSLLGLAHGAPRAQEVACLAEHRRLLHGR